MAMTKTIHLSIGDSDHCKRLRDPYSPTLYHLEALLPFGEIAKLDRGNANVRPHDSKKPAYRDMTATVEDDPEQFHVRNRGITYLCDRFEYDNAKSLLKVIIPALVNDDDDRKYGIGDGGHTFGVVNDTIQRAAELRADNPEWVEPYARVHFIAGYTAGEVAIDKVVEALNTSAQVKQFSLDEYANKFDGLKKALLASGFDTDLIAFRENEDKEWSIEEIIQRMACFLKERWSETHPAAMYKSKSKALEFFTDTSGPEFEKLFGVIKDVITLPEYMQSVFSKGDKVQRRSLSKLRVCKGLKTTEARPGTNYPTDYRMDMAALLPMAAAFRELLRLKDGQYEWRLSPYDVFAECAPQLYSVLTSRLLKNRRASQLGADTEYWSACAVQVLKAKDRMLSGD